MAEVERQGDGTRIYVAVQDFTRVEAEALLAENNPQKLLYVPIGVSLYSDDLNWAEDLCIQLSKHSDPIVRGNAILGFGHLARRFGSLRLELVTPIVEAAMHDPDKYVVMQASDATDDIKHYTRSMKNYR